MFGTSGIRGPIGETVTADTALSVGRALASEGYHDIVVGRDPRESGRMLEKALTSGLVECGANVIRLGQAATPTVARSVSWHDADAGVAITASHNPPCDNGLKLWTPSGQAFDAEQRECIASCIEAGDFALSPWDELGETTRYDHADDDHRQALCTTIESPLDLSVIVDLGTGAGRVTVEVLTELGCAVETLNAQPDGRFPGRPSEPTAANCATLRQTVAHTDADLGIAHDGDADRMLAVDETGTFIPGDVLLALFAQQAATPGDRVAAPVDTSLLVDDALSAQDVTVMRTKVGDVFVAQQVTMDDVAFGGEPSGAWIWPEETLCPDGPLAACKLAELVATEESLSTLIEDIETYPIRRQNVETTQKAQVMAAVENLATERYNGDSIEMLDGVRIETENGWMLIRASGTQPLIRLTTEARTETRADALLSEANELVATAQTSK
ncbi:phosphoglucosamine mutase [Haloplanus vescus]|uniref:Phosphoglucosamine mutase n=1 Tax=Haloplanus vescus TaxID=555874 RepID=A0A1H3XJP0_9EURY|nr:phosphoglucosamine mutase [Haloplanus vescus]SDZ98822.1 phosphoglucosamine mutase [Haloplanus vescus]